MELKWLMNEPIIEALSEVLLLCLLLKTGKEKEFRIILLLFLPPLSPEACAAVYLSLVLAKPSFYETPRGRGLELDRNLCLCSGRGLYLRAARDH